MQRYRLYVGPTLVRDVAERLRDLLYDGVYEGTENVYFLSNLDHHTQYVELRAQNVVGGARWNDLLQLGGCV